MVYTTPSEVSAELGGFSLTASSTPTSTQVESWISDAESEVNELTGRVWESTAITSTSYEYQDYDGSGTIRLKKYPVISVQSLEYDAEGLGAASTVWSTLSEGRTSGENFILYKEEGLINFHSSTNGATTPVGRQNMRLTYTHGTATTPNHVKRLTTLITAKRLIMSVASKAGSEEGGSISVGTISVDDPNNYVHTHLKSVSGELEYLLKHVTNTFKPYIFDSEVYD